MRVRAFKRRRRCINDNWRLPNRYLARWGLLSLADNRPVLRLSYVRAQGL